MLIPTKFSLEEKIAKIFKVMNKLCFTNVLCIIIKKKLMIVFGIKITHYGKIAHLIKIEVI